MKSLGLVSFILYSRLLRIQLDYVRNLINARQLSKFAFASIAILRDVIRSKWARLPGGSSSQTAPGPIIPGHYV